MEEFSNQQEIKALVVDDNEVNVMVVASMLEQFDIEIEEAFSGKEAVEKVKEKDFDIIFMDYLMPEMNGIEATQKIRQLAKEKRPVIIALSANETQDMKMQFESAGVDDVLSKPLDISVVSNMFKKWVSYDNISKISVLKNEINQVEILKHALEKVEDLDVDNGLGHLANHVENYVKVLEAAIGNIQSEKRRLEILNASQTQVTSMKNSFHSLKGVFLNIGAIRLSESSHLLENAARNQEVALVKNEIVHYLENLDCFVNSLEQGLVFYKGEGEKKDCYIPMDQEEYLDCLEALKYYLKRYEFNYLTEITEDLIHATKGEKKSLLEEVKKEIENFQYESALVLLEEINPC